MTWRKISPFVMGIMVAINASFSRAGTDIPASDKIQVVSPANVEIMVQVPGAGQPGSAIKPLPAPVESNPPIERILYEQRLDSTPPESGNGTRPEVDEPLEPAWLNDLSLFLGLDGSKGPEDLGINANMGFRAAVNWGYPIWERAGLGVQLGTAINYSETAVRVIQSVDGVRDRFQSFTTVGIFQRTDIGLDWAFGHDFLSEHYYQGIDVGQWRAQIGWNFSEFNEVGLWGAWRDRSDNGSVAGQFFNLQPIPQINLFWKHVWENDATTRMWIGMADEHGRFVLVAPGKTPVHHPFVFGADLFIPLSTHLALFGEANFITPNDTGTVTATLGFAFIPGGAHRAVHSRFAPMLNLANNPNFALDLRQ
jgi:hypothetical protein